MSFAAEPASLAEWFSDATGWTDAILPDYTGGSVANLAATVVGAFGVTPSENDPLLPPIRSELLDPNVLENAQIIVAIVIDGLSERAYRRGLKTGMLAGLPASSGAITSVFPSTTAAALTSLHLGIAPACHGMAGYTLYLPSQRRVVNMIHFKPVDGGGFTRPFPDPSRMVTAPMLFERLATAGIESVVVSHREYAGSPLTKIHSGSTPYRAHRTLAEFAALLRTATETTERRFVLGYWAGLDMLAHTWGPESPEALAELTILGRALSEGFVEPLRRSGRDVAVLITSDHGHHAVHPDHAMSIAEALRVSGGLRHPPTGERRAMGLRLRRPENVEVFRNLAGDRGTLLNVREAMVAGLYGPGRAHLELHERVGDALLIARGSATFLHASGLDKEQSRGAHGSLTADEMLVPLLAARLR